MLTRCVFVGVHSVWLDCSDDGIKWRPRVNSGNVVKSRSRSGHAKRCEYICCCDRWVCVCCVSEAKSECRRRRNSLSQHTENERGQALCCLLVERGVKKHIFVCVCVALLRIQDGMTALMLAANCDHIAVVEMLLNRGAQITMQNNVSEFRWELLEWCTC